MTRKTYRIECNIIWIDKSNVRVSLYFSARRFLCNSGMLLACLFVRPFCGSRLCRWGRLPGLGFHSRRARFGSRRQSDFLLGSWNFVKIDGMCNRVCGRGVPSLSSVFLCLVSPSILWAHHSGLLPSAFHGSFFIVAPFIVIFDVPYCPFFRGFQPFVCRGGIGLVFQISTSSLLLFLRDFFGDLIFDISGQIIDWRWQKMFRYSRLNLWSKFCLLRVLFFFCKKLKIRV